MDLHQTAITAAFVTEGLHDAGYDHVIKAWDKGAYELVDAVMACVPIIGALRDAVDTELGDDAEYPGVFDYEVSSFAGEWLGQCVIADGDLPDRDAIIAYVTNLVVHFFARSDDQFNVRVGGVIRDAATTLLNEE
jgi:hypothetical protein